MILDEQLLNQLTSSRILDEGLKGYLLTAYGQEPFPHVYSEYFVTVEQPSRKTRARIPAN